MRSRAITGASASVATIAAITGAIGALLASTVTVGARLGHRCRAVHLQEGVATFALDYVTLVDPHLHADTAVGGVGMDDAVINVGSEGVERHAAFHVPHGTRHFGTTQAA